MTTGAKNVCVKQSNSLLYFLTLIFWFISQIFSVSTLVKVLKLLINVSFCKLEENTVTGRNHDTTFLFMKIHLTIQSSNRMNLGDF